MSYHIRSIYFFNTPFISQTNRIKGAIWHIYSIEICVFMDRFHPFHFSIYLSLSMCVMSIRHTVSLFHIPTHIYGSLSSSTVFAFNPNSTKRWRNCMNKRKWPITTLSNSYSFFCHHQFHQLRFGFMSLRFRFYEVCSCFYYWFVHLVRPNFDWIAMHCCHTLDSVWNVIIEL